MRIQSIFLLAIVLNVAISECQSATIEAEGTASPSADRLLSVPASETEMTFVVDLPTGLLLDPTAAWELVDVDHSNSVIPVQRVASMAADGTVAHKGGRLVVTIAPHQGAKERRRFRLRKGAATHLDPTTSFRFQDISNKSLGVYEGDQPILVYNHGRMVAPQVPEKDHRKTRACYIHPVYGLDGEVLTADFPPDHFHHHGIFWGWPYVKIENKVYDSWECRNIKYRFVRWLTRNVGNSASQLAVENGWFVGDRKVVIERVWIETHRVTGGSRAIDLDFVWIPVDHPLTLQGRDQKSYGGMNIRFDVWPRKNGVVTTPNGVIRQDGKSLAAQADLLNTPLPWADMSSTFSGRDKPSGAALFVRHDHPDYPPTWLTRCYGPLCVGWPGVTARTFPAGKPIQASYRLWIHGGEGNVATLSKEYLGYLNGAKAIWKSDDNK